MKQLYFCSCAMGGGVYHYTLENGEMIFREKTELDNPMYGSNPRDFLIVDGFMFVTNEFTNDVMVLKLKNGIPELTDIKLHMLKPICVVAN